MAIHAARVSACNRSNLNRPIDTQRYVTLAAFGQHCKRNFSTSDRTRHHLKPMGQQCEILFHHFFLRGLWWACRLSMFHLLTLGSVIARLSVYNSAATNLACFFLNLAGIVSHCLLCFTDNNGVETVTGSCRGVSECACLCCCLLSWCHF